MKACLPTNQCTVPENTKLLQDDHFVSECPNTTTNEETDYEDADPASLQMMSQSYSPVNSEREADYLNL